MFSASMIDRFRLYLVVNKSQMWTALKVLIAVIFIGLVISRTTASDLILTIQQVDIPWIGLGFIVYLGITFTSGKRYWALLDKKVSFQRLMSVVIMQTVISSFVATGAGAVSYIAVLRGEHDVPARRGFLSLVISRLGDVISIWLALVIASWVIWETILDLHSMVVILGGSIFIGLFLLLALIVFRLSIFNFLRTFFDNSRRVNNRFTQFLLKELGDLANLSSDYLVHRLRSIMYYSFWFILLNIAWGYCNIKAFQVPIGFWPLVFMVSITQLISIIPVYVFGGLGINEVTFMFLYGIFGISQPEIAPFLVSARLLSYIFYLPILIYIPIENWARIRNN